jgi:hypothetical protein
MFGYPSFFILTSFFLKFILILFKVSHFLVCGTNNFMLMENTFLEKINSVVNLYDYTF